MTSKIEPVPKEIVALIPQYKGDKRQLNLYLRKCEYVIERYSNPGREEQNLYVFNVLTSKLTENAAALLSEREDVVTWSALKELLIQHFGDPRSEECINIELESLKIKSGESYLDFCNRIQSVRSLLISKVNIITDTILKRAKLIIYNNTALNVFLYNLPEAMVRVVRLKSPKTLEDALSVVLEEVNFLEQYNMRNRLHGNSQISSAGSRPLISNNTPPKAPQVLGQTQGFGAVRPPTLGYRLPFGLQPQPPVGLQQFGYKPPQQFGYRPAQQFGYKPPQQLGYKPPPQLGYKPQQFGQQVNNRPSQFGYRPQFGIQPNQVGHSAPQVQKPQMQISDVSMRTAPPRPQVPQQGFKLNELTMNEYEYGPYYDDSYYYDENSYYDENGVNDYSEENYTDCTDTQPDVTEQTDVSKAVDFQENASKNKRS
ncbi:Cytadhesion [Operophtera brumata]|uniref:Cytadhesion n=1 Tax=Operophtera brumata TaxID=104452 RepID=A0A0L7LNP2_OPEBR|nr:Cytadhesion [Operophtera brumata]